MAEAGERSAEFSTSEIIFDCIDIFRSVKTSVWKAVFEWSSLEASSDLREKSADEMGEWDVRSGTAKPLCSSLLVDVENSIFPKLHTLLNDWSTYMVYSGKGIEQEQSGHFGHLWQSSLDSLSLR